MPAPSAALKPESESSNTIASSGLIENVSRALIKPSGSGLVFCTSSAQIILSKNFSSFIFLRALSIDEVDPDETIQILNQSTAHIKNSDKPSEGSRYLKLSF